VNASLRQYWALLARHIRPQRGRFVLLVCLLFSSIGLRLVIPQILRGFIDVTEAGVGGLTLARRALAFIGIALLEQALAVAATYVGESVAWTATNALRAEMARHCLRLDMRFHNSHRPGELIERIDGDVAQLASFFSQVVVLMLGNLLLLLGILSVLYREGWRLGLAFTLFSALSLLVMSRVRNLAVPYVKARRQAEASLFGYIEEQLSGAEDLRSSGAVAFVLRGLYALQYEILGHDRKASTMNWRIRTITGVLLTLGQAMAVAIGYYSYRGGLATVGTVYLLILYMGLLARPIRELTRQVESLQTIEASIERLTELRETRTAIQDGVGVRFPDGPLSLAFHNVSLSYEGGEPALKDLTFHLGQRKVLGVLGRTGSGKTTLARVVVRLYDPSVGHVAVSGLDTRQATLEALRQRVAYVTQDVQLFEATVRDNMTFFNPSIPDERILAVVEELELGDWYRALPAGLDTRLEAGGRGLSAGEGQLLAFTRVFLRDPGLVILDEASSRLDTVTEQRIERAVDRLLKNRTAIVIAHRLRTVHRADEIMILEDGRLDEHGPREELTRDPTSRFYALLQTGLEEVLV
jgi:ATP-binding cassette subfamily B protein